MGRHSAPSRSSSKAAVVGLPLAAVVGLAGIAAAVHLNRDDAAPASATTSATGPALPGCPSTSRLRVTTTEDMAPTLKAITRRLEADKTHCVDYTVITESASVTASGLMSGANESTQVWVPDSSLWAERVTEATPTAKLETGPVIATSPVVFTVPQSLRAKVTDDKVPWSRLISQGSLPVRVATPERSTSSLLTLLGVQQVVTGNQKDATALNKLLLSLSRTTADERELQRLATEGGAAAAAFPASEQQVYALNAEHPQSPARAITPAEAVPQMEYPLITVQGPKAPDAKAVQSLRDALADAESVAALRKAGFRVAGSEGPGVEGVPQTLPKTFGTPKAKAANQALQAWVTMSQQTRMLTVFDTSESMKRPGTGDMNRIQLATSASVQALAKFHDTSQIGLWSFDLAHEGQPGDWVPRVPVKALNDGDQRTALAQAARSLTWQRAHGTALYDTMWAAYQEMQRTYEPDFTNAVILITDGKNEDPNSITEQDLITKLQGAAKDTSRPVRLVLLGISPDADFAALKRIEAAVPNTQAYDARNPARINAIVQEVLASRNTPQG